MNENSFIKNPQLPGDNFFWKGNQTGILLIHGFTATTAEVRRIAEKLHEVGFTTAAPLLPGHGTHPDDLNQTHWQDWIRKTEQTYAELIANCDSIFIIGESMGALLALELGANHPEIDGLLLFSPAIKVPGLWITRFIAPFKPYLKKTEKDDGLPWKGYTVYPLKAVLELLKLQKHVREKLPKITQSTRVFTGEYDRTISSDSVNLILDQINAISKSHVHLTNSAHCILLDRELDQVFENVLKFIDEILRSKG